MGEIIKVKNQEYAEYEDVLLERDRVRKEALQWKMEYTREFGQLMAELFEKKITCIKKKKIISYCQAEANRGKDIDYTAMLSYVEAEMKEYNRQLADMIAENESANSGRRISTSDAKKIKRIYHSLAKLLHPDINPKTDVIPELKKIWNMIVVSYNVNDLAELESLEVMVKKVLEDEGLENIEPEIDNLPEKIQGVRDEITEIKGKEPYQYKFLLEDYEAVKSKKEELEKEKQEYVEYEQELDKMIEQFLSRGVSIKWEMNLS